MRFELNLKVVDVLLKVPTINLHEKYVQWKASRFMRRAYLPKTFSPLPFCEGTQQTEAPSEHQQLCSDGHPPVRLQYGYRFYYGEEMIFIQLENLSFQLIHAITRLEVRTHLCRSLFGDLSMLFSISEFTGEASATGDPLVQGSPTECNQVQQ